MKVGFSGTRKGMTPEQLSSFIKLIDSTLYSLVSEFHHGDCLGADVEARKHIISSTVAFVVCHPPTDPKLRANTPADATRPPLPYLARDRQLVNETDILIACPDTTAQRIRSGTWYTIRYARSIGRKVYVIFPDGKIKITEGAGDEKA